MKMKNGQNFRAICSKPLNSNIKCKHATNYIRIDIDMLLIRDSIEIHAQFQFIFSRLELKMNMENKKQRRQSKL